MHELPIYSERTQDAGPALSRKLSHLQALVFQYPAEISAARSFLRRECALQTLKLTGTEVSIEDMAGTAVAPAKASAAEDLIWGQVDALERVERSAEREGMMGEPLILEVHRLSNPTGGGRYRSGAGRPQFRGVTPSRPELIAEKVEDLLVWLRAESGQSLHPPEKATLFFARFLEIAPFESGNFRSAHLLMNLFGFVEGYPPFFFRVEETVAVREEIEKAMRFDTLPLVKRMALALDRSLDVCLESANRKNRSVG